MKRLIFNQKFKRLEDAGAALVEVEVVPGQIMEKISKRTSLITVSLGSGTGGDVMYLFMEDLCGETPEPPRHARAFCDLATLHQKIKEERVAGLKAFREASLGGQFPANDETISIDAAELEGFLQKLKG